MEMKNSDFNPSATNCLVALLTAAQLTINSIISLLGMIVTLSVFSVLVPGNYWVHVFDGIVNVSPASLIL